MIRFLILWLSVLTTGVLQGQSAAGKPSGFTLTPAIKAEAELYFTKSEFSDGQDQWLIYNNRMFVDFYQGDKLIQTTNNKETNNVFKSFYYWKADTLQIDGGFGLSGGVGFTLKIINGQANVYHLLIADYPGYAYSENGSLRFRLEVPCTESKVILSELPDPEKKQILYGYVEFKSAAYFTTNGSANGQEIKPRNKGTTKMKVYFKSSVAPY